MSSNHGTTVDIINYCNILGVLAIGSWAVFFVSFWGYLGLSLHEKNIDSVIGK